MRQEKQLLLDDIKGKIDTSNLLILLRYQKMTANSTADFRSEIHKAGGSFTVVGKRVFVKAASELGLEYKTDELDGHIAFVASSDHPIATTKTVYNYQKDNKDAVAIVGGKYGEQKCVEQDFKMIADLPTKDEMRAQFVGLLEAPMAQVVNVVNNLLTSPLHCMENKCQKEAS